MYATVLEITRGNMPKPTKKVSYKSGYPEIRIIGRFLTDRYGLKVGDTVRIEYGERKIVIRPGGKNVRNDR